MSRLPAFWTLRTEAWPSRRLVTCTGPPLPKPARILVVDFAVSADDVTLSRGFFSGRGEEPTSAPATAEQREVGRNVARAGGSQAVSEPSRTIVADAKRTADAVATRLEEFFAAPGLDRAGRETPTRHQRRQPR